MKRVSYSQYQGNEEVLAAISELDKAIETGLLNPVRETYETAADLVRTPLDYENAHGQTLREKAEGLAAAQTPLGTVEKLSLADRILVPDHGRVLHELRTLEREIPTTESRVRRPSRRPGRDTGHGGTGGGRSDR